MQCRYVTTIASGCALLPPLRPFGASGTCFQHSLTLFFCLLHPILPNHLGVIQQTSTGKTHILCALGIIKRGIVLIFIILLMLSANVMSKFTCANQRFGAVIIQHLDMLYDSNKPSYKDLLERCKGLLLCISTTVFIFMSPP